jgi:hypothetical protein
VTLTTLLASLAEAATNAPEDLPLAEVPIRGWISLSRIEQQRLKKN